MGLALALGLARGLHMAGSYAVFGTALAVAFLLPSGAAPALRRAVRTLAWSSLLTAFIAGCFWFLLQSADMASASDLGETLAALPLVAQSTRFGHLLLLRCLLLLGAALCVQKSWPRSAVLLGGIAIIAEAWLGHGGAMTGNTGTLLLLASIVHLAGGAAWIGTLPALFLLVARLPQPAAARLAQRYSRFGIACVAALTASAIVQFTLLIGSPAALLSTAYGRVAGVKILLLAGLLLLAALNRYRLAPALAAAVRPGAKRRMLASIGCEIALGVAVLLAAGLLLNLEPPRMAAMVTAQ